MSKIVLKSLSILLGAFFIFLGVLKLSPKISKDLHKDLRNEYAKYAKVFPLAKLLDFKVMPLYFCLFAFFWKNVGILHDMHYQGPGNRGQNFIFPVAPNFDF